MTSIKKLALVSLATLLPTVAFANAPYYGGMVSYLAVAKEPPNMRGYQVMLNYDPQAFQWRQFNIYFDGGFTFFSDHRPGYHSAINIYSIAPVIRFTFRQRWLFHPYLDMSIGIAHMNHTQFEDRQLGIRFCFQDRFGLGILLGQNEQLSLGFWAVHYSNAHLSNQNSGISAPVMVDLGYRFH